MLPDHDFILYCLAMWYGWGVYFLIFLTRKMDAGQLTGAVVSRTFLVWFIMPVLLPFAIVMYLFGLDK